MNIMTRTKILATISAIAVGTTLIVSTVFAQGTGKTSANSLSTGGNGKTVQATAVQANNPVKADDELGRDEENSTIREKKQNMQRARENSDDAPALSTFGAQSSGVDE
ncbi:MAG: hypothetical protein NUV65_00610 [Candidatus Roizmanbacteria bacterium]|nr:hypothetical protein [Candidatus Roizmanbacteria bacterium]